MTKVTPGIVSVIVALVSVAGLLPIEHSSGPFIKVSQIFSTCEGRYSASKVRLGKVMYWFYFEFVNRKHSDAVLSFCISYD